MQRLHRNQRGSALVITVGFLAVLAVIGFGFAVLARLHHDISGHYQASAQKDLIAHAAIHYAIRDIRYGWEHAPEGIDTSVPAQMVPTFQIGAASEPTDSPASSWYVDPTISCKGYTDAAGKIRYCNLHCNSYALVHDDLGDRIGVSMVKVFDCAGKLNINDDYGGNTRLESILQELFSRIGVTGVSPSTIASTNFTSLNQLKQIAGITGDERKFEILKHYLTIFSWPHGVPSIQGFTPYVVSPDGSGSLQRVEGTVNPPNNIRSRININTASKELLAACLVGITYGGIAIDDTKANAIADWIVRKRDFKSLDYWAGGSSSAEWQAWLPPASITQRQKPSWRSYPLGPFDTWHEVTDFLYSLTDGATNDGDPFPTAGSLTVAEAEAVLAGICPNSFATLVGHNTWSRAYPHMRNVNTSATLFDFDDEQLRDKDDSTTPADIKPQPVGKNELASNGDTHPFCFSSMGRFEIYSRTYAFVKAFQGTATASADPEFVVQDSSATWASSPPQWRGYSLLIYDGKGKGQLRGIVQNASNTLTVGKLSVPLDTVVNSPTQSRYYIVGPAAFVSRIDWDPVAKAYANKISATASTLTDSNATWEDDEWNGHRLLLYRASISVGGGPNGEDVEQINNRATIQERVIIDTDAANKKLVVAPDFDTSLLTIDSCTGYMILGSDGYTEHEAAVKAYDVIHHTTQEDFEKNKGACTNIATGPNAITGAADASRIDGWVAVAKEDVPAPGAGGAMVHNFKSTALTPDSGGQFIGSASKPTLASDFAKDVFADGVLTSEGLYIRGGVDKRAAYKLTSALVTDEKQEGGFVSFWFRPSAEFFTGSRTLIRVVGSLTDTANDKYEDLRLVSSLVSNKPTLKLIVNYDQTIKYDTFTYNSSSWDVKFRQGSRTFEDTTYSDVSAWKPGEWHHIAFAWYECANDDQNYNDDATGTYNNDAKPESDWRDDEIEPPPDPADPTNLKDDLLDVEVIGRLRVWIDGKATTPISSANDVYAFNLKAAAGADACDLQVGYGPSGIGGTVDGLIAYRLTGTPTNDGDLDINVTPPTRRYKDGADPPTNEPYAIYNSPPITLPNSDAYRLGSVAWTAWVPWCTTAQRWDAWDAPSFPPPALAQNTTKYPVHVQDTLATQGTSIHVPLRDYGDQPALGGGGALRDGLGDPIEGDSSQVSYKVYLYPNHGQADGDTVAKGKVMTRQTPVLDDITITYMGSIVFFHWH